MTYCRCSPSDRPFDMQHCYFEITQLFLDCLGCELSSIIRPDISQHTTNENEIDLLNHLTRGDIPRHVEKQALMCIFIDEFGTCSRRPLPIPQNRISRQGPYTPSGYGNMIRHQTGAVFVLVVSVLP